MSAPFPIAVGATTQRLGFDTRALRDVIETRVAQVIQHGHTAEKDRRMGARAIVARARAKASMAEDMLIGGPDRWSRMDAIERAACRRRMVEAAAMLIAAIDVLDADPEEAA